MINLNTLSYSELQQLAKKNNIKANQKKDILISLLSSVVNTEDNNNIENNNAENNNTDIAFSFMSVFSDISGIDNISETTLPTKEIISMAKHRDIDVNNKTKNQLATEIKNIDAKYEHPKNTQYLSNSLDRNHTIYKIESLSIHINGIRHTVNKDFILNWVFKCFDYFKADINLKSRIINNIPDLKDIYSIDIQMTQAYRYEYDKNNKLYKVPNTEGKNIPQQLNKNGTEFTYGIISPPAHKENSIVSNRKSDKNIWWDLVDDFPYLQTDDKGNQTVHIFRNKYMYAYVSHIHINEKPIISSIVKLKSQNKSNKTIKINPLNRVKNTIIDNWLSEFTIHLKKDDLYSDIWGVEVPIYIQIIIENSQMYLYHRNDGYSVNNSVNDKYGIHKNKSIIQKYTKICRLCTLEYKEVDSYRWIPLHPRYESIADSLNKGIKPYLDNFKNVQILSDKVCIGDRVLVEKRYIGTSTKIVPIPDNRFVDRKSGNFYQNTYWIHSLISKVIHKAIQGNCIAVSSRDQIDSELKCIIKHKYKTLLTTYKKVVRETFTNLHDVNKNLSGLLESDIYDCAELALTYLIKDMGIADKHHLIGISKDVIGKKCLVYNLIHRGILNKVIEKAKQKYKHRYIQVLDDLLFHRNYNIDMLNQFFGIEN